MRRSKKGTPGRGSESVTKDPGPEEQALALASFIRSQNIQMPPDTKTNTEDFDLSFKVFHELMAQKVTDILLVSSPYEAFIMEEEGRQKGIITELVPGGFDPDADFVKIGKGLLGGKARGLAFFSTQLRQNPELQAKFQNIDIRIPKTPRCMRKAPCTAPKMKKWPWLFKH